MLKKLGKLHELIVAETALHVLYRNAISFYILQG